MFSQPILTMPEIMPAIKPYQMIFQAFMPFDASVILKPFRLGFDYIAQEGVAKILVSSHLRGPRKLAGILFIG